MRLRPVEAGLSPSYEIVEDDEVLVREAFNILLHAVQNGTLNAELEGTDAVDRGDEATQIVLDALNVGLRAETREGEWRDDYGLDALVGGFIQLRDVPPPDLPPPAFDFASFQKAAKEFVALAKEVAKGSPGADWIVQTASVLNKLRAAQDPIEIVRETRRQLARAPRSPVTKKHTFSGQDDAWQVWRAL